MTEPIDLAFAIDGAYAPALGVVLASIVAATSAPLRAHVLHDGVDESRRAQVQACAPAADLRWLEVADPELLSLSTRLHISRATTFRLAAADLLPLERVLYLDADVLVLRDLAALWSLDLQGRSLAAGPEALVDAARFAAAFALPPSPLGCFNAGVLLMDLAAMRRDGLPARLRALMLERWEQLKLMDQDALNITLWNAWTPFDAEWNAQRAMLLEPERFADAPAIVHFNQGRKPWQADDTHPFALHWWETLSRTPFAREVVQSERLTREVFEARRARYATWRQLQVDRRAATPTA